MNALEKKDYQALIHSARIVVREIGYCAMKNEEACEPSAKPCPECTRITHAYDMACAHLQQLDPAGAPEFIRSTYGPAFRQTEVTK